jgi:hypothetical protein
MTMVVPSSSYASQIEKYSGLHAQSVRGASLINMELQKLEIYEQTIKELETEKRSTLEKLEAAERIVSSLLQQESQLREDIATGEQFAACFMMRSLVHHQDDDPPLEADAETRETLASEMEHRASDALVRLHASGQKRVLRALHRELASPTDPNLRQYAKSCDTIIQLVKKFVIATGETAEGASTSADADNDARGGEGERAGLAEQLFSAVHRHLSLDELGWKLAERAAAQMGNLEDLQQFPRMFSEARAVVDAQHAEASDGEIEEVQELMMDDTHQVAVEANDGGDEAVSTI